MKTRCLRWCSLTSKKWQASKNNTLSSFCTQGRRHISTWIRSAASTRMVVVEVQAWAGSPAGTRTGCTMTVRKVGRQKRTRTRKNTSNSSNWWIPWHKMSSRRWLLNCNRWSKVLNKPLCLLLSCFLSIRTAKSRLRLRPIVRHLG